MGKLEASKKPTRGQEEASKRPARSQRPAREASKRPARGQEARKGHQIGEDPTKHRNH